MASTPSNSRVKPLANTTPGPFLTPSNPAAKRPPSRSQHRSISNQPSLSLRRVIGTTASSPNGFDCLSSDRTFALCAGSAVILAHLDEKFEISQRFFRARPQANAVNPAVSYYNPSSASSTTLEPRIRVPTSLRDAGYGIPQASPSNSEWGDSPGSKTWTARERVKSATCVSLSPDGKFLAIGETGYSPRVLLFSTLPDASCDVPLSILMDHSFGVRCVAFSPDSQYLATLGNLNDAFLFIWSINPKNGAAKLQSSNKCTATVRDLTWMGNNIVTVGTRHIKVWRVGDLSPPSPTRARRLFLENPSASTSSPKALSGRNCLLHALIDDSFSCVATLSAERAIICSDKGQICLLDDAEGEQKLTVVTRVGFGITSVTLDHATNQVWVGGKGDQIQAVPLDGRDLAETLPSASGASVSRPLPRIIAMGCISNHLISVDSAHSIKIRDLEDDGSVSVDSASRTIPAHQDSVLGVRLLPKNNHFEADFFTWSSEGLVRFWNMDGMDMGNFSVTVDQLQNENDTSNELRVLRAGNGFFISGDKYGVLRLLDGASGETQTDLRAHASEVTDISIHEDADVSLVATSGRDRMVQLFQKTTNKLSLIQTLDDHIGAVNSVLFLEGGNKLLSCSSDRTIIVRERVTKDVADDDFAVAYFCLRVIQLKSTPSSMTTVPRRPNTLVVSTVDRQVQKYDMRTGRHLRTFRASDPDSNDSVVLSALTVSRTGINGGSSVLVGVSSTDKSIRVYDYDTDALLTREFGHSEGVSDVVVMESSMPEQKESELSHIVSTGIDGTIMIWDLFKPGQEFSQDGSEDMSSLPSAARPPLRRILSKSELALFQGSDDASDSPTQSRPSSPRVRKRTSKRNLQLLGLKLASSPAPPVPPFPIQHSPLMLHSNFSSKDIRERSPTPPSPHSVVHQKRRSHSLAPRSRTKSASNVREFGSLAMSTEQTCRALRAYRKKLHMAGGAVDIGAKEELERELQLTLRILDERERRGGSGSGSGGNGRNHRSRRSPSRSSTPSLRKGGKANSTAMERTQAPLTGDGAADHQKSHIPLRVSVGSRHSSDAQPEVQTPSKTTNFQANFGLCSIHNGKGSPTPTIGPSPLSSMPSSPTTSSEMENPNANSETKSNLHVKEDSYTSGSETPIPEKQLSISEGGVITSSVLLPPLPSPLSSLISDFSPKPSHDLDDEEGETEETEETEETNATTGVESPSEQGSTISTVATPATNNSLVTGFERPILSAADGS